jgi:glucose-6-phosphate 1-dehydrogenase
MTGEDDEPTILTGCQGFAGRTPAHCLMVIFGASGDLTGRSLLPSLFELALKDLLPERFAVPGFAQQNWSKDDFRVRMRDQTWSIVDPVVSRLASHPPEGFLNYAAGSWGPEAAAELLERDGRRWKSD